MDRKVNFHVSIKLIIAVVVVIAAVAGTWVYAKGSSAVPVSTTSTTAAITPAPVLPSIGVPQNKNEGRLYVKGWKNVSDSILTGDVTEQANYVLELQKDTDLETSNARNAVACNVCRVVPLEAPRPAPPFETLVGVVFPDIRGDDNEPLSREDIDAIDRMQNQTVENLNRYFRNSQIRWAYSMYIKDRALSYANNPKLDCPPPQTFGSTPSGETPPGENPPTEEQRYKKYFPQTNDQNGDSSLAGPQRDVANGTGGSSGGADTGTQATGNEALLQ